MFAGTKYVMSVLANSKNTEQGLTSGAAMDALMPPMFMIRGYTFLESFLYWLALHGSGAMSAAPDTSFIEADQNYIHSLLNNNPKLESYWTFDGVALDFILYGAESIPAGFNLCANARSAFSQLSQIPFNGRSATCQPRIRKFLAGLSKMLVVEQNVINNNSKCNDVIIGEKSNYTEGSILTGLDIALTSLQTSLIGSDTGLHIIPTDKYYQIEAFFVCSQAYHLGFLQATCGNDWYGVSRSSNPPGPPPQGMDPTLLPPANWTNRPLFWAPGIGTAPGQRAHWTVSEMSMLCSALGGGAL